MNNQQPSRTHGGPPNATGDRRRRRFGDRRGEKRLGAAIVEFALIANLMFMLILTCIEFARMNMVRNLAQDAAYFAARHAIVPGATADEAKAEAEGIMDSLLSGGYTVDVENLDINSDEVVVTVTVDLQQVALFVPLFLGNNQIETQAVMRTERYEGFYEQ
jgi:Flp pilus assembly protein TadG